MTAEPEPEPPPPPRPVQVRVLHLAAGAAGATVSASAGPASVSDVAFKSASAYAEMQPPSEQGTVPVQVSAGDATATFEAPYRAGVPATLIVVTNPQDPTQVVVNATEDDPTTVMGQLRGRFVNALLGTEAIDFCLPGATAREPGRPIFTGVQYGQVAGTETATHYIPVSLAGGGRLQGPRRGRARLHGPGDRHRRGAAAGSNIAHNLTLVVVGRMSGRPAVARELLVCEDAPNPSACAALPLR
ncbi:MAG: hypothetical protein M5U28_38350 [Sandaracinaceae bacterium]|nr:hypothetical protein [Sandaracinaceae bacterium]